MIPERVQPVLDETRPLAEMFSDAGKRLYLVGGIVRDLFEDRASHHLDIDLTTDALPEEVKEIIGPWVDDLWTQGERFGTIGASKGDRRFEITTHRADLYQPESRKPVVEFSSEIEADLSRRDFTVNAMALEVTAAAPSLIDPFGGLDDLAARRLRTPLSPEASFDEDPLRMMRAARLIADYDLVPDADLRAAVERMHARLGIVSAERIRDELDKLILVDDPSPGVWFLYDTGLSDEFLPELSVMRLEQDPLHRHKDVLTHTVAVVSKCAPRRLLRLAALFHDVGKPKTRAIGPHGVSFHHHEVVGARMTRERMRALKYSNEDIETVSRLVYLHLRFHTYRMGWTDSAVRRYVRDAGPVLEDLIDLTRSDCTTRNRRRAEILARRIDELEVRIAELQSQEELARIRPDLDGREVMEHLGIGPGPLVGEALGHLLEVRLEEGPLGREEAILRLDEWWAQRGPDR